LSLSHGGKFNIKTQEKNQALRAPVEFLQLSLFDEYTRVQDPPLRPHLKTRSKALGGIGWVTDSVEREEGAWNFASHWVK
jgi:hypothetical protein